MLSLSNLISNICKNAEAPVILMIDEVDQARDHKVFIDFLGMLRSKFLKRRTRPTFQSVILAGVYDIKNLKHRIREDHEHQMNSPWNIAADFSVDMSFTRDDIASIYAILHIISRRILSIYSRQFCDRYWNDVWIY